MMTQYLNAIDRTLYNTYVDFNLGYLNELKLNLFTPMHADYAVNNILAKDEMDEFKIMPADAPKKLHTALVRLIDDLYFFNEEEKSVINGLLTYLDLSPRPDLGHITRLLANLQELHVKHIEVDMGDSGMLVYAKMLYNRSRIMALQSRGLQGIETELVTDFDKLINANDVAAYLSKTNSIHLALTSVKRSVIPSMKDKEICAMILDVCEAMLTYRRSLISPDKAGMGDFDLAASEQALMRKDPTPAAGDNLKTIIELHTAKNLAFTPADFLLSINEGVRLSGMTLMV